MSSFHQPHGLYLFDLANGKKKLAYGSSPEDALQILGYRLTDSELAEILPQSAQRICQRELQQYVHLLG